MLRPEWAAPRYVHALVSTRQGGVSTGPWASLNISHHVGDEISAVNENRLRLKRAVGAPIVWMSLVHGANVVRLDRLRHLNVQPERPVADAAWTTDADLACAVTAADCLPVFFCTADGSAVGVAHAGWRGLAAGVLQNTVTAMCSGTGTPPQDLHVWLGPCIGPSSFEVGDDVLAAFGADRFGTDRSGTDIPQPDPLRFRPHSSAGGNPRWLANLPQLARDALLASGVHNISGGGLCTVLDSSRFFSFRRDGVTGRMLAAIWRSAA